ncbi:MAG: DUF1800 family protein [Aureliella sp.]
MNQLDDLDPAWAWAKYEVVGDATWAQTQVSHLVRRAAFGASPNDQATLLALGPSQAAKQLLEGLNQGSLADFERSADQLAKSVLAGGNSDSLSAAWVYRLLHTPHPLQENATLFWHGHFATGAEKVQDARMMWQQNRLLRANAMGDLENLVQGIAQDPAMLVYLDSVTNRKSHPNENFARELMELFCLGEGHYSEKDVQELSRCFTGWEIKNRVFRKNRYQQDRGSKSVLGKTGNFDGEDAVRIVLEHPQMPYFVCEKLVRYFVFDEPRCPAKLLEPLAATLLDSGLSLKPVLQQILSSNLFYSPHAFGRKIRGPVDFAVGLFRTLEASTNTQVLARGLRDVGQGLLYPPNVKGWDGGRAWINSSTLIGRSNLIQRALRDEETRFGGGTLADWLDKRGIKDTDFVSWLSERLLAVPLQQEVLQRLEAVCADRSEGSGREERLRATVHALVSIPEYQLG